MFVRSREVDLVFLLARCSGVARFTEMLGCEPAKLIDFLHHDANRAL